MVTFMGAIIIDNYPDITIDKAIFINDLASYIFLAEKIQQRHNLTRN
jgi:hypothetical protein